MNKTDTYRKQLNDSPDWIKFLADNSNLPGPRGNLELLAALEFYRHIACKKFITFAF